MAIDSDSTLQAGEESYPRFYIDGIDAMGQPIVVVSKNVVEAKKGGEPSPAVVCGGSYRYFVRSDTLESGQPLLIECYNRAGRHLGNARITYAIESTFEIRWDGL